MSILSAIIMENEGLSLNDLSSVQRMALRKVSSGRFDPLNASEKEEAILDSLVDLGLLDMGYDMTPDGERAARLISQYSKSEREDLRAAKQLAAEIRPELDDMASVDDNYRFSESEEYVMKTAGLNEADIREIFETQKVIAQIEENYNIGLPGSNNVQGSSFKELKDLEETLNAYHKKNPGLKYIEDLYNEVKAEIDRRENGDPEGKFGTSDDELQGQHIEDMDELEDGGEEEFYDEPEDQFRDDVEADADALASAGFGTDEDYGVFDDPFENEGSW